MAERPTADAPEAPAGPQLRSREYLGLVVLSALLGAAVAAIAAGYVWVYHEGIHLVWHTLPDELGVEPFAWWLILLTTTVGGVLVGLVLRFVPGNGGPSPVAGHSLGGSADYRVAPAAALTTIVSLVAGASLGPEAALVTIAAAVGALVAARLELADGPTRLLGATGIAGVLGSLFGNPLAAAMLMLETLTVGGPMLYAILIPGLVAATIGGEIFQWLLGDPLVHYDLPGLGQVRLRDFLYAALVGIGGAIAGRVFIATTRAVHTRLDAPAARRPIVVATAGGLAFGVLGLWGEHLTLFSGESSLQSLVDQRDSLGLTVLLYVLVAKIAATAISMTTGFRGGQIFPVMFVGAAFGVTVAHATGDVPDGLAIACGMVASTVAVMRVPIAAILIVTFFIGVELVPVVVIAAAAAYITSFDLPLLHGRDEDEVVTAHPPPG
jgi:H+/Cl- antiporter ClcA